MEISKRVEKFIEEHTRNCSNLMQVPTLDDKGNIVPKAHPWLTPDQARKAVEIARKEVIEKICSFIEYNMGEYIDIRGCTSNIFINVESDRFINDLKQAIKDE